MTQDEFKQAAARAALRYVVEGSVVGVGTGTTANFFIEELGRMRHRVPAAVASSEATAERLRAVGIAVVDLNQVSSLPVYVDGADEIDGNFAMIKGGGGALTREKIVAAVATSFICVADQSKFVSVLGRFPLPVEVVPIAREHVVRQLVALGGAPRLREGFTTDNGNIILDVRNLSIGDPVELEARIDAIAGVVTNGLFARRPADVLVMAGADGLRISQRLA